MANTLQGGAMQLHLQSTATTLRMARPVVALAAGTLLRHMNEPAVLAALRDGLDFVVYVRITRFEQVGSGVPMESPMEPGRVGHCKADGVLTIDIHYNEINMVHDRVERERPGQVVATSRDYLDTFAERMETAVERIVAWCDRQKMWADREAFAGQWERAIGAANAGEFVRPYEFTATPKICEALDACWALIEAEPVGAERYEEFGDAYFLLRDAGWQEAVYVEDPEQEPTLRGQPCKVGNFEANVATSQAPDPAYQYSLA